MADRPGPDPADPGQDPDPPDPNGQDPGLSDPDGPDPDGPDPDRSPGRGALPRVTRFGVPWLQQLGRESLDPGYAAAARRRQHGHARPRRRSVTLAWLVAAMVLAGAVIGAAVRSAEQNAPNAARARSGLLDGISAARQREQELDASVLGLDQAIRAEQRRLGAAGPLQTVTRLEYLGAATPVTGPGLRVVIDGGQGSNAILDRDVQLLVNGLWSAGAEAVSIGGIRLRATSAIRQAGGAILVDNKPTFWPVTIEAIGDPDGMHVAFSATSGFARFASFAANYGTTFELSTEESLTLPAAPAPEIRYAEADPSGPTAAGSTRATR